MEDRNLQKKIHTAVAPGNPDFVWQASAAVSLSGKDIK
jgi:hypothetical protein